MSYLLDICQSIRVSKPQCLPPKPTRAVQMDEQHGQAEDGDPQGQLDGDPRDQLAGAELLVETFRSAQAGGGGDSDGVGMVEQVRTLPRCSDCASAHDAWSTQLVARTLSRARRAYAMQDARDAYLMTLMLACKREPRVCVACVVALLLPGASLHPVVSRYLRCLGWCSYCCARWILHLAVLPPFPAASWCSTLPRTCWPRLFVYVVSPCCVVS